MEDWRIREMQEKAREAFPSFAQVAAQGQPFGYRAAFEEVANDTYDITLFARVPFNQERYGDYGETWQVWRDLNDKREKIKQAYDEQNKPKLSKGTVTFLFLRDSIAAGAHVELAFERQQERLEIQAFTFPLFDRNTAMELGFRDGSRPGKKTVASGLLPVDKVTLPIEAVLDLRAGVNGSALSYYRASYDAERKGYSLKPKSDATLGEWFFPDAWVELFQSTDWFTDHKLWKLALANHRGAASVRAAKRAHTAKAAIARRKLKQSKPKPQLKGLDDIRAVNSFK